MSTYKRGRVWWYDFTDPTSKIRYRESTHQRDEVIADLLEARRKIEVGEASRQALLASLQARSVVPVAHSQLERLEAVVRKATEDPRPTITIGALRDDWLKAKSGKKTVEEDKNKLKRIIAWLGSDDLPLHDITSTQINNYIDHLLDELQPPSVNRYIALLKGIFNLATKKNYRHQNPMTTISLLPENNERDRIATTEEYEALVNNARDPKLKLAIILARETGMRRSELAKVTTRNYRDKPEPHLLLSDTKNGDSRVVPLNKIAVTAWKQYGQGVDLDPSTITHKFRELCIELKIEGLRFHDLRAGFATALLLEGVDSVLVSRLTGHRDIATLNRRYARLGGQRVLEIHKTIEAKRRKK